ncbi:MAG: hypothetical protein NTV79_08010 [Candidatus Aureabacteria bacterium]|nr:hypothetical protein [Candidatus Auribacterota bacterium]
MSRYAGRLSASVLRQPQDFRLRVSDASADKMADKWEAAFPLDRPLASVRSRIDSGIGEDYYPG